jgi:hypothetical protein
MTQPPTPPLPLFYKSIRALDRQKDGALRMLQTPDFAFTLTTNAVPLVADEFPYAGADYPIVFAPGDTPVPVAVVGIQLDRNIMVDPTTKAWRTGAYIPAYVRRYPFILVEDPESKQMILCLEENAPQLSETEGAPLFRNDEPTDFVKRTLDFCMALRQQGEVTEAMTKALQERDLLQPAAITVTMPKTGRSINMDGFLAVDRKRFAALPGNVIADWHRREWLELIYAHLNSSLRWQKLADIVES